MISIEALQAVNTIVTHANCADGIVSALLCKAALPAARVLFLHYGTTEHRTLAAEPGMLFVDMTPLRERAAEFVAAGAIVLDHHEEQAGIVAAFGERGVYSAEPGTSGAVLAYCEVYSRLMPARMPGHMAGGLRLAQLAGIYDTWQTADPEWDIACQWREVQIYAGFGHLAAMTFRDITALCDQLGPLMFGKAMAEAKAHAARAHRVTIDGVRFAIIPTKATNYVADIVTGCDVVAGHAYAHDPAGRLLTWSLRGCSGFVVSTIAKRHPGGGGHPHAAGFSVPDDGRSPYARLGELLGGAS